MPAPPAADDQIAAADRAPTEAIATTASMPPSPVHTSFSAQPQTACTAHPSAAMLVRATSAPSR
jgi:hypothetical protein